MDNNNNNFNPQQPNGSFNNPNVTPQDYQAQNYQAFNPNQNNYNQNFNQQPNYGGPVGPMGPEDPGKGLGIAAMVCGIAGLVLTWCYGIGFVPSIVGLILSIISGNKSQAVGLKRSNMATAGLICSIISLALSAVVLICTICTCVTLLSSPASYYYY